MAGAVADGIRGELEARGVNRFVAVHNNHVVFRVAVMSPVLHVAPFPAQSVIADRGKARRARDWSAGRKVLDGAVLGQVEGGAALDARVGAHRAVCVRVVVPRRSARLDARGDGGARAGGLEGGPGAIQRESARDCGARGGRVSRGRRREVGESGDGGRLEARRGRRGDHGRGHCGSAAGAAADDADARAVALPRARGEAVGAVGGRVLCSAYRGSDAAVQAAQAALDQVDPLCFAGGGWCERRGQLGKSGERVRVRGGEVQLVQRVVQRVARVSGHGGGGCRQ